MDLSDTQSIGRSTWVGRPLSGGETMANITGGRRAPLYVDTGRYAEIVGVSKTAIFERVRRGTLEYHEIERTGGRRAKIIPIHLALEEREARARNADGA